MNKKAIPAIPFMSVQASVPRRGCVGAGRSHSPENICHDICDLLAVCRPLRSVGPLPVAPTPPSNGPSLSGAARLDTRQVFNVFGWLVGRIVAANGVIEPHQKLVKY